MTGAQFFLENLNFKWKFYRCEERGDLFKSYLPSVWAYERTLLQSADNRLVRKYLTQLRAYKYNFKKTGKPRKLQTDETFVALVCRSHVISFRCSLMFFCLWARIIRTRKYSQIIRMFRKSVCECNNYNVRTMSSIPSVETFRKSAFFLHGYEH